MREIPGFLGTDAHLLADITLLAYVLLLLPLMLTGFLYARRKQFVPHHKLVMTMVVILNWVLILVVMVASFLDGVAPGIPNGLASPLVWLPSLHLIIGGAAQLLGTYLALQMWFEDQLPTAIQFSNIKRPMRLTLVGWVTAALMGIAVYGLWYVGTPSAAGEEIVPPVATEEALGAPAETEEGVVSPVVTEEASAP